MAKFVINLLPPELLTQDKNKARSKLVVQSSIGLLILLIICTSVVLSLRIVQSSRLSDANSKIKELTQKIESLNVQENLLNNLKKRLVAINTLSNQPYPKSQLFNSVIALVPETSKANVLSLDKSSNVSISGESSSSGALQTLFTNLLTIPVTKEKLSTIKIGSLSRGNNDKYIFEIGAKIKQ